ncbi:MAG TPA: hypothetical protein VLA78_03575 [Paracoccaceae bacterium]|nr:hypothetical protein [Paracoccaceae bacterium]
MSEPMTTTDIEDVLSSIRKLVSEDMRPAQPRGPLRLAPEAQVGRLILTPALRVTEPESAPRPPRPEAVVAAVTAAPEVPRAEDLPEPAPEAEPVDDVHAVTFTSVRLEGVVASIGAAVDEAVQVQPWEPETGDAPVTELPWVRPAAPPAPEAEPEVEPEPEPQVQADLPKVEDVPPPRAGAVVEEEAPQVWSVVDTEAPLELDEEALREIIRDVIREELQGQLGERMTRNIRKLVRAEVQRALTVRDFD